MTSSVLALVLSFVLLALASAAPAGPNDLIMDVDDCYLRCARVACRSRPHVWTHCHAITSGTGAAQALFGGALQFQDFNGCVEQGCARTEREKGEYMRCGTACFEASLGLDLFY